MARQLDEDLRYQLAVTAAADRYRMTDHLDLCDLADAASQGFNPDTFARDVERAASEEDL